MWILIALVMATAGPASAARPGASECRAWVLDQSWSHGRVYWVDVEHPDASDRGPGSYDRPWRTPDPVRGTGVLGPGDAVIFRAGTYGAAIRPAAAGTGPDKRITFAACPDEHVVISGVDPVETTWTRVGEHWESAPILRRGPVGGRHDRHILVARGNVLHPVASIDELAAGSFHVEPLPGESARIRVILPDDADPAGFDLRIGRRGTLFGPPEASVACPSDPRAGWYRLIGLTFEHAANPAQHGAVCLGGSGVVAEQILVTRTNGLGIEMVGTGHVLRASNSTENGQAGIGGQCRACLLEDVRSDRNNWRNHDRFWEAGGGKWTRTHDSSFVRYSARDNDGVGIWFDGDATRNRIVDADIEGSEVAALMLELGADSNRVEGGVFSRTRYRGWSGSGILMQAAGSNTIDGAEISGNEGKGIWVRSDGRVPTGGLTVTGALLIANVSAGRPGDFEVTIEQDVAPGESTPRYVFETSIVRSERSDRVLGVADHRGAPVRAVDPERYFGRFDALRIE